MELTAGQRRTLYQLIGVGPPPDLRPDLVDRVRARLEERLGRAAPPSQEGESVWLGKHRLNDHERCEGRFQASLLREGPPFEHNVRTAAGALFHKGIELDVGTERSFDTMTVCEQAARRLSDSDPSFGTHWASLDPFDRAELLAEGGRRLALFRDSFPPLARRWAPQPEMPLRAVLAGGRVVLSGAPDLVLGRTRRLVLDFKSGRAWPEHPEDMRFYALLMTLRTGMPPYRVATFFLDSGEWQAEDVTEETLGRAEDRVVAAAATAWRLAGGGDPRLAAGPWCTWCPRMATCPAARGRVA